MTVNQPDKASASDFNFNLTIYDNFPSTSSYPEDVQNDPNTLGYTILNRFSKDPAINMIGFPGQDGGVSVDHIGASYGKRSARAPAVSVIAGRVGAHEFITHYLLGEPGHPPDAQGITRNGFDFRRRNNVFLSNDVKNALKTICSKGEVPL